MNGVEDVFAIDTASELVGSSSDSCELAATEMTGAPVRESAPERLDDRPAAPGSEPIPLETDPIEQLRADLVSIGLEPHLNEAMLTFVLGISRYAGHACSVGLQGPSSTGKTTLVTILSDLLPTEDVRLTIDVTFAAMAAGFGWDSTTSGDAHIVDLRKKLIILDERTSAATDQRAEATLRQALTAPVASRLKMERGQAVDVRLLGPTSVWDCRLDSLGSDYQSVNRLLPVRLKNDPETLEAIAALAAERPTLVGLRRTARRQEVSRRWRRLLRRLDDQLVVIIDFADQIRPARSGPGRINHAPRLMAAVHAVVAGVAWLRQDTKQKYQHPSGKGSMIFASHGDYETAYELLTRANVLDERPSLPACSLELLRRWQSLAESSGNQPVTAPALYAAVQLSVDRGNMTRQLQPLLQLELARELPHRNQNNQKLYQLTSIGHNYSSQSFLSMLPPPSILPSVSEEG